MMRREIAIELVEDSVKADILRLLADAVEEQGIKQMTIQDIRDFADELENFEDETND